jgi:hypothetical protein
VCPGVREDSSKDSRGLVSFSSQHRGLANTIEV